MAGKMLAAFAASIMFVCGIANMPAAGADLPCPGTCGIPHPKRPAYQSTARSYPVCFFQQKPDHAELSAYRDKTASFMKVYLGRRATVAFAENDRWISARGLSSGHKSLKLVWPRIGCVGHYVSQSQYVGYKRCLVYLQAVLRNWDYTKAGKMSEGDGIAGQLFCDGE
jgi:hypothetical protein